MLNKALRAGLAVSLATVLLHCGAATASSIVAPRFTTVSSNWAGYAITGSSSSPVRFKRVSANWVEPAATCSGRPGYAGFWVGLGGYRPSSRAIEQIGTEADCASSGSAVDFAWYELVPKSPVRLRLRIHPGDSIAASVTVTGTLVRLALRDLSTRASYVTTQRASVIDVSSAEWIAEAPSVCHGTSDCSVLPLADFGSVTFSDSSATSTNGRAGPIGASAWSANPLELLNLGGRRGPGRFGGSANVAGATPSSLTSGGAAFTVAWEQPSAPSRESVPVGPFGAYGALG